MADNWQAIGAIATAGAALVALVPIFRSAAARKSKARNLRMRLSVKFMRLRPTIAKHLRNSPTDEPPFVYLSNQELRQAASEIENLLAEAECLEPEEQDRISQVVANLQLMIPAMEANQLPPEGAEAVLMLCDRAIAVMEEHGLLHGDPEQPWVKDDSK